MHNRLLLLVSLALLPVLHLPLGNVQAQSVIYTFEQFTPGQTTPILNAAPDVGTAAFNASFTAAPNANGFVIDNFQPNPLFSGNSLIEPFAGNILTVTLNMPIDLVSFVFATASPGSITFSSAAGSTSVMSSNQGGAFEGGILTFNSAIPFTVFTIMADGDYAFAIDNLTMRIAQANGVPEGGSTLLLLACALVLAIPLRAWVYRKRLS